MSDLLCDTKIQLKLKGIIYQTSIKKNFVLCFRMLGSQALTYAKYEHNRNVDVSGIATIQEKIKLKNEITHHKVEIAPIEDKMHET